MLAFYVGQFGDSFAVTRRISYKLRYDGLVEYCLQPVHARENWEHCVGEKL